MLEILLVVLPLVSAASLLFCGGRVKVVRGIFFLTALAELVLSGAILYFPEVNTPLLSGWLYADIQGSIVAHISAFLFFCTAVHSLFWLPVTDRYESHEGKAMKEKNFCALVCAFVSTMMLAAFSCNFGLMWVAVEATTLVSAPLITFRRSAGSLEAMWKYLLICSAGIGLALFGTFLLGVAVPDGEGAQLAFSYLSDQRMNIDCLWFKAAFIFCFAGYGLKMGLAPFHTWLPDAHSEAPSMVSVLLSGALLNCSFLAITRVADAAPVELSGFCREFFVGFGLLSLLAAAFFLICQRDYKRLLAYSSVEHMGLLAIFWGLGLYSTTLAHMTAHSVCKMALFLCAGNILLAYGTRRVEKISGLFGTLPLTASIWLAGVLMICGMPPSPLFATELQLVMAAGPILGGMILFLLFAVFCGMTATAAAMTMGKGSVQIEDGAAKTAERLSRLPGVLLLMLMTAGAIVLCKIAEVF